MNDTIGDGPVIAIDYGDQRTGVAISDASRTVARPLEVVDRASSQAGMQRIHELIATHDVTCVVVGLPIGLRGETHQTQRTQSFIGRLRRLVVPVPVVAFDERFTSRLADYTTRSTGTDTARDALAACHLLTSWISVNT